MTAVAWNRHSTAEKGLQPFDARHHLRQVAELISRVFADELDANGRSALQEMELVSRLSPLLGGLLSTAFFSEFVLGYVWVEGGKVIGNVTFQRADATGTRWRISNVAVTPEHRRRGIARDLMLASLREIAMRGGSWSILQVRSDNPGARRLYENLKFTEVCQEGVWQREPSDRDLASLPAADPDILLQPLSVLRWQERLELARAARTPLADWVEPIQASDYQPRPGRLLGEALGNLTGLQPVKRWGAWDGTYAASVPARSTCFRDMQSRPNQSRRLKGWVEAIAGVNVGTHSLRFNVHPDMRGILETTLINRGLRDLADQPPRSIIVEHSGDDAAGVAALEICGFKPQRILVTMRRLMMPADTGL